MEQQNELDMFVDSLIKEAGVEFSNEDNTNALREELKQSLQERIGVEAINMLDDDAKVEYVRFIEADRKEEEIQKFFFEHIENFQEKMQGVVMGFAKEFVDKYKEQK